MVPGHDPRERGLLVGVDVLVRDADRLLGGDVHAVVREQELEHVVLHVRAGGPGDRPEDPDPLDLADQQVEDPQRDRGLARLALGRGDVDAASGVAHSLSPPVSCTAALAPLYCGPPSSVAVSPTSGHTQSRTSGMSSPCSRVYWRAASRASTISWRRPA
ncbi:Uncharacterised protein [Mycobacteroides abscessus]|nr:Uncharacterised protein [Mycobacteroides abscessus]